MSNVAHLAPALSPLKELQKRFALAKLGGKLWLCDLEEIAKIMDGTRQGEVQFSPKSDGKDLLERHLQVLPVPSNPNPTIKAFWVSPHTSLYTDVAFSPLPQPATTLNYWVGSTVNPVAGDWSLVRAFLQDIICAGDPTTFDYLLDYLAHALQRPEDKPGVMIVLMGGQGTGKGSLFRLLNALWSRTTLQVSAVEHVVGGFNAALERSYLVLMDEAFFAGDKKSSDRLKSMITEPTITVEQKHQPRRTLASFHRFFAATNHDHFGRVDPDDRRFVFLRVSDDRKGDQAYWTDLHNVLANPVVIAAVADALTKRDISGFNVRSRPRTAVHMGQKLRSLSGFDRYWHEVLQTGSFHPASPGDPLGPWTAGTFVSTRALENGYNSYCQSGRQFEPRQQREIHEGLARVCKAATRHRQKLHNLLARGYSLPALPAARVEFEQFMGGPIDWEVL